MFVYWTRFGDDFTPDDAGLAPFLERVADRCAALGLTISFVNAWDHIVNPQRVAGRPIDTSAMKPKRIRPIDGGMVAVMSDESAMTDAAYPLE